MSSTTADLIPVADLVAANRTRATAAGIDPNQYERVTRSLVDAADWNPAFMTAAAEHRRGGDQAAAGLRSESAGEAYIQAALFSHFASTWPNPNRKAHRQAIQEAARAYRAALAHRDPDARWFEGREREPAFVGVLRRPKDASNPPLVLLISGLDSGKEEFNYVSQALLARGLATFAFDGPGQGELSAETTIEPEYQRVTARVLDALQATAGLGVDLQRVGAIALSLGGFYGLKAAAAEPRIGALATVSGVCRLPWEALPPVVTETLIQRCSDKRAAQTFAATVDSGALAAGLHKPLLVVAGGEDPIPAPEEAKQLTDTAPSAELLFVAEGDHLLANSQWQWLGHTCDWLTERLARSGNARSGSA
jgi:alpha-beta hydrolase superfamily lysophospholipase